MQEHNIWGNQVLHNAESVQRGQFQQTLRRIPRPQHLKNILVNISQLLVDGMAWVDDWSTLLNCSIKFITKLIVTKLQVACKSLDAEQR